MSKIKTEQDANGPALVANSIWIIDDDDIMLELLEQILRDAGFQEVHCFSRATEVLVLLKHIGPDLIITDLHMPELSGAFLAKLVADFPQLSQVPMLAVTADDSESTRTHATSNGIVEVIQKPVDADKLVSAVEKTLRQREVMIELNQQFSREKSNSIIDGESSLYQLFGRQQ